MTQRVVVVITEGATPELLSRWGSDAFPAFQRLFTEGAHGLMRNAPVPYEPPALLTAFTGYSPAEHGCFSYWDVHSPSYQPEILDSSSNRRQLLWHRPEFSDKKFAILNVFGTHPVRPLNGCCISYPMRQTLSGCVPRTLPAILGRSGIRVAYDVAIWFSGQPREQFITKVLAADRWRADAALHLFEGGGGFEPDLTVLNLTAIDRLSHAYWQEVEPGCPIPTEEGAVFRAYQLADRLVGRVLDRLDDHTNLLAFSEIGFGPLRSYVSVNTVLAEAGLLTFAVDGIPDWLNTTVFESVQGSQGLNVNLAGRYERGTVAVSDREKILDHAREVLLSYVNPLTGTPLFADIRHREEVYSGPEVASAPDLILHPYDWRYLPLGDTYWTSRVSRTLQSGWHRTDSYWAGVGPAFRRGAGTDATPLDIAPTVVNALGEPALPDLAGRVLDAA